MAKTIQTKREREKVMVAVRHVLETKKEKRRLENCNEA